jgi:hypothetical protein
MAERLRKTNQRAQELNQELQKIKSPARRMQIRNHKKILWLSLFLLACLFIVFVGGAAKLLIVSALLAYIPRPAGRAQSNRAASPYRGHDPADGDAVRRADLLWSYSCRCCVDQLKSLQTGFAGVKTSQAMDRLQTMVRSRFGFLVADVNLMEIMTTVKSGLLEKISKFLIEIRSHHRPSGVHSLYHLFPAQGRP